MPRRRSRAARVGRRTLRGKRLGGRVRRPGSRRRPRHRGRLRAEAGPAHDALITDLFEKITLVGAKTTRATAVKRPDGKYEVTLEIAARKLYADRKGVETEAPLDEPFDIGVFTAEPGTSGFKPASVLYMQRQPIKSGTQTVTVVVDKLPTHAGIYPYNKRIDRNSDDNLMKVELKEPSRWNRSCRYRRNST